MYQHQLPCCDCSIYLMHVSGTGSRTVSYRTTRFRRCQNGETTTLWSTGSSEKLSEARGSSSASSTSLIIMCADEQHLKPTTGMSVFVRCTPREEHFHWDLNFAIPLMTTQPNLNYFYYQIFTNIHLNDRLFLLEIKN